MAIGWPRPGGGDPHVEIGIHQLGRLRRGLAAERQGRRDGERQRSPQGSHAASHGNLLGGG